MPSKTLDVDDGEFMSEFVRAFYPFMNVTVRKIDKRLKPGPRPDLGEQCTIAMSTALREGSVTLTDFQGNTLTLRRVTYTQPQAKTRDAPTLDSMPKTRTPVFIEGFHRDMMKDLTLGQQYAMEKIACASEHLAVLSLYVGIAEADLVTTQRSEPPKTTSKKPTYVYKNRLEVEAFNRNKEKRIAELLPKIAKIRAARWEADIKLLRFVKAAIQGDPAVFADAGPAYHSLPAGLSHP